jgi:quinol monooxygenase YgiN
MRCWLLPLLAAGSVATVVATQAQAQQNMSPSHVVFTYTGEVLRGQDEAFKQLVPRIIAAVEQEPGTRAYQWNMRSDGKTFDVVEIYQDSSAVVAHVKDVGSKFGKELGKTQKTLRLIVYGDPDAEAKKAIEGLHPEYETPFAGFIR